MELASISHFNLEGMLHGLHVLLEEGNLKIKNIFFQLMKIEWKLIFSESKLSLHGLYMLLEEGKFEN